MNNRVVRDPETPALVEIALAVSLEAYRGKVDKAGQPYILHPLRLMARFADPAEQACALLHDVLEDSNIAADDLLKLGIPETVVNTVIALTRREGESYMAYIDRLCACSVARKVKKADLEDNLNVLRLSTLRDADLQRMAKYHKAWHRIEKYA